MLRSIADYAIRTSGSRTILSIVPVLYDSLILLQTESGAAGRARDLVRLPPQGSIFSNYNAQNVHRIVNTSNLPKVY